MNLEDLVEAHLNGETTDVPGDLRAEFDAALEAHAAIQHALRETILVPEMLSDDRSPPQLPGEYQVIRELGRGGMGVVYLASQQSLGRDIAVKVLRPGEATYGPLVRRFMDEARHLARLRHPNIVSIHEVGEANGEPYFTMDFIDGEPLSAVIHRGPMSPTQALEIIKQVAAAVQHAHRQGIVHRDLKPSNVLIDRDGTVFVTDFGLARDISQSAKVTQTGELLGTPQYMAPEQARGQASLIGEATDIHALGLLLFEMLTGEPAFASPSPADVLVKLLHEEARALRSIDRRIPRDLETICQKMLQKSPDARYASVSALLEDIRRFETGEPLKARRTSFLTHAVRWSQRHWKIAASAVVVAAVTATLAVLIAAPLFDKSFEQLIAWGDEEFASGNPAVAARVYTRALNSASDADKLLVVDRIAQTCRSMDDPKAAVDLALSIIDVAPDKSFGKHDLLVAKSVVAREYNNENLGETNIWHSKSDPILRLVKTRLELALQQSLSEDEKLEAEEILTNVNLAIADSGYPARYQPEYLYKVPTGSEDELRQLLDDQDGAVWNRAKAGIALGRLFEQNDQKAEAVGAYRQAYELARSIYPMYEGVKDAVGSGSRLDAPDAQECVLVHELVMALNQLDPQSMPLPKGRVEFEVVGMTLPPTVHIDLVLKLFDPSITDPHEGLSHNLPRLVPLRQDRPVSVSVLDGTYRLDHSGLHSRWDADDENVGRLVQVDIEDWPREITVRGDVVKLPPIRVRLTKAIELQSPASGEAINLSDIELRWTAVPDAKLYRLHLSVRKETPYPSTAMFLSLDVDNPRFRFAEMDRGYVHLVQENLVAGSLGEWRVDAYDADGRCIGKALQESRFLVAETLSEP
jgi:predicted Ser/Thr protein kinase